MMKFTILVIASVLASGLHAATVQTLPFFFPETRPLPIPVNPEDLPEAIPEVEAVIPDLIDINPCSACFEHITALIDQLTDVSVPEVGRPLPEGVIPEDERPAPESGVVRPLPEGVAPEDERPAPESGVVRPLPEGVLPEDERPVPESGVVRPLPEGVVPEVEVRPLPVAPEFVIRPAPLPILIPLQ